MSTVIVIQNTSGKKKIENSIIATFEPSLRVIIVCLACVLFA